MKAKDKIIAFIKKYNHAWVFLYGFIYIPWFVYLEKHVTTHFYIINSPLDKHIPFVEYFIIPYYLWFVFMAVYVLYFFFSDKKEFYQLVAYLVIGMTTFLIVCTVFPNGLMLRPETFARDNIFVDMVKRLYETDTPTNVLPSIHVFNSVAVAIAISRSEKIKSHKVFKYSGLILAVLIVLSTMFLKQHSVTDVVAGIALAALLYPLVYVSQDLKSPKVAKQPV